MLGDITTADAIYIICGLSSDYFYPQLLVYVPVFWIQVQVQLHFDIVHKPWFFGAYVDTAFAEVQDDQVLFFLHTCSVFFLHFRLT